MKKLLGLLAIFLMFNSCDDGDLDVDNIDLGDVQIKACSENDILYKLSDTEVLILLIPENLNPYQNIVDTVSYQINTTTQVRYRLYNGSVATNNICATIQPGTPQITEEWIATSGTIEIKTTAENSPPDETTGATKVLRYNHEITFKNIKYAKPDGSTIVFSENLFGDYTTTPTTLPLNFNTLDPDVERCDTNNKIYNVAEPSTLESLVINNISETLINNELKTKTEAIGLTTNNVVYQLYRETLPIVPADYFCASTTPILPTALQTWTAQAGNSTTEKGYIEVTTEDDGAGQYKHTIYLIGATFTDEFSGGSFYYGNKILYGVLRTKK